MTQPTPDAIAIDPSQLTLGLYVWLDLKWMDHPFLTNRVMIKTPQDLAILQSLPLAGKLHYIPSKSTAEPLSFGDTQVPDIQEPDSLALEHQKLAKARQEKMRHVKDAAARAERAWEGAASATREALVSLARSPRASGQQLSQLSRDTAAAIAQGPQALLHLLGTKEDHGPQFHALNVMTLCMLVGHKVGLSERDLTDLAMAALAHDAGKADIPLSILRNGHRKKHEEDHYRLHVKHSVQLARESNAFNGTAIAMIADHHEAADGSGWPQGKTDMSVGARILAMANRYDRLCTPEGNGVAPLMPAEALAHMLRNEVSRYDPALLRTLISLLGVYPPGTVVKLNDGSLALSVSPGEQITAPRVLLYSPDMPETEAPMLDLSKEQDLKVVEAIRPTELPPDVLLWLNPQKRLAYYFSVENGTQG